MMEERCAVLAAVEGLGRVYDCGNCGSIHLQIGMVNLTLAPEVYLQLVAMMAESATNFEVWLRERPETGRAEQRPEPIH